MDTCAHHVGPREYRVFPAIEHRRLFTQVPRREILGSPYAASCRETGAQPITLLSLILRTESDYDILYERIKMRLRGYMTVSTLRYFVHAVK